MSYALKQLEEELKRSYKDISYIEEERDNYEEKLVYIQDRLKDVYQNIADIKSAIQTLKGETK